MTKSAKSPLKIFPFLSVSGDGGGVLCPDYEQKACYQSSFVIVALADVRENLSSFRRVHSKLFGNFQHLRTISFLLTHLVLVWILQEDGQSTVAAHRMTEDGCVACI
jgi:hypothetical protein